MHCHGGDEHDWRGREADSADVSVWSDFFCKAHVGIVGKRLHSSMISTTTRTARQVHQQAEYNITGAALLVRILEDGIR